MRSYTKNGLAVRIDLERPEAPIMYCFESSEWEYSPFQTASLPIEGRDEKSAWALVERWFASF